MPDSYLQVFTTIDSEDAATQLARSIIDSRLAACAQVLGPIKSCYWWQGEVETASEWICFIKTTTVRFEALADHIKANHSYDVPEITASPITHGSTDYLTWISKETSATA